MNGKKKLLTAAAVTLAAAAGADIINRITFFYSTVQERLRTKAGAYYEWRFGKVYYTKQGNGKPLLLVHRLDHTASGYEWQSTIDELAKNHTVYTLDLLGCGRSDKPKITYTNYIYVQLLNDFVREVIKGRTDIVTNGSSSSLAAMAALVEPGLYNRLMFLAPENISESCKIPRANHKALKYLVEMPIIGTLVYNIVSSKKFIARQCETKYFSKQGQCDDKIIDMMNEAAHLGGSSARYTYASVRSHFTNIFIGNTLRQLDHSIFIVTGDEEIAESYMMYNQAIECELVDDAGMLIQVEKPEETIELCNLFLA